MKLKYTRIFNQSKQQLSILE